MNPFPIFCRAALLGCLLVLGAPSAPAQAQGYRPSWGPAAPSTAQYYYLPEVGGYYDLRAQQYLVQRNGQWQRVAQLDGYNPGSWHPVVIDYVGDQPWSRHDEYRRRYPASLPPGQAKRLERGKGLPPGQAKKYYGDRYGDDHQGPRYEDGSRRYEIRDKDRHGDNDDRDDDRDHDGRGKKNKGPKGKGKDRD